jgi:ribosomal protein S18 acetylase RimI-like enzyme
MHISSMTARDVDAVDRLAKECGFHIEAAKELARSFAHCWLAWLDHPVGEPQAFLLAWQAADELDVIAVGAAISARRSGLGRALVEHLLKYAVEARVRRVILEVRCSNVPALNLYHSLGFEDGRIREDYYSEPSEDGLEMSLEIDDHASAPSPKPCLEA